RFLPSRYHLFWGGRRLPRENPWRRGSQNHLCRAPALPNCVTIRENQIKHGDPMRTMAPVLVVAALSIANPLMAESAESGEAPAEEPASGTPAAPETTTAPADQDVHAAPSGMGESEANRIGKTISLVGEIGFAIAPF